MNEDRVIWQCESYNKTMQAAAAEFCRGYWDVPRKMVPNEKYGNIFCVVDGSAWYAVREVFHTDGRLSLYQIARCKDIEEALRW